MNAIVSRTYFGLLAMLVFISLWSIAPAAYSKSADDAYYPVCGGKFGLCGYVDRQSKKELIPKKFRRAMDFSEELAAVNIDGKFGFIDKSGRTVIAPKFDLAGAFYKGHAEVLIGDYTGIIDRSGKLVIPAKFQRIVPLTRDMFIAVLGEKYRNGYRDGYERLEEWKFSGSLLGSAPQGLYHIERGWITGQNFNFAYFDNPSRGLIWATESRRSDGPWGLMRADGTWQVKPVYTHAQSLHDDRAVVRGSSGAKKTAGERTLDPSGAVDGEGRLVIPLQYEFLSYWAAGYGLARKGEQHGLVKPDGKLLAGRYFDQVDRTEDGRLPRGRIKNRWFSIEADGTLTTDQNEGRILSQCPAGLIIRERSGKAEFTHPRRTRPIGSFDNSFFGYRKPECSRPVSISSDGKWGFVTQDGRLLTDPLSFETQHDFGNGFAVVKVRGKWGIIDEKGKFTLEPRYSEIRFNRDGFRAILGGREHWLDAYGNSVAKPAEDPTWRRYALKCGAGVELFDEKDRWGMRDQNGIIMIPPIYRALSCYANGVAWAAAFGARTWCPIGPDGNKSGNPACRTTYYPEPPSHHSPESFHHDPHESSVLWTRARLDYGRGVRDQPPGYTSHFAPATRPSILSRKTRSEIESVSNKYLLPAGGLVICLVVGWLTFRTYSKWPGELN